MGRQEWINNIIYFQDMDSTFFSYPQPKIQIQECSQGVEEVNVQDERPEVLVRDEEPSCSPERDCRETSSPPGGDTEREGMQRDSVAEKTALDLHLSSSVLQHASPMHTRLQDIAHTPEALKQHRNTLAMELLWIQQAIASRKKDVKGEPMDDHLQLMKEECIKVIQNFARRVQYLTLKQKMDMP
ncbi:IQ domain-containing protein C isoform X3 [Neoarius graeffei]|uniref:IQ domain-containing protein C isoform X3 n=1 Tax=Neoarius graeffei TaxID=443677 RepID=UPI00298C71FD|nr:IQ domain-containing protein C isoform X3 [Neoarius graeffei]